VVDRMQMWLVESSSSSDEFPWIMDDTTFLSLSLQLTRLSRVLHGNFCNFCSSDSNMRPGGDVLYKKIENQMQQRKF
jgi:hypothetical protein